MPMPLPITSTHASLSLSDHSRQCWKTTVSHVTLRMLQGHNHYGRGCFLPPFLPFPPLPLFPPPRSGPSNHSKGLGCIVAPQRERTTSKATRCIPCLPNTPEMHLQLKPDTVFANLKLKAYDHGHADTHTHKEPENGMPLTANCRW